MWPSAARRSAAVKASAANNSFACRRLTLVHFGQFAELAVTVAESLPRHPQLVQQRQLKIRERRMFGIDQVAPALDGSCPSPNYYRGQRTMRVPVAIADTRAQQDDGVIQQ